MMMRSIRANTKWIMLFLAVAFAAWLVLDWVQSRDSAAAVGVNPVIAVVNGEEIRYVRWNNTLEVALANARAARGGAVLTDEESRQVRQLAWDQMIQDILIEQEIVRLGIKITDAEVQQAFRLSPPPDLMQHPAFQTDGVFDYAKYQQFFADPSVDDALLLQIESYYRQTLPRVRLSQMLQLGGAISDAELWREFRDRNETASVTFATVTGDPASIQVDVSDDDMRRYYREHTDDFERPATASIQIVSFSTLPDGRDTTYTVALADSIRTSILDGSVTFEEAALSVSADAATRESGGMLGRFAPNQLLPAFQEATAGLDEGEISEPVLSPQGYHLLTVSEISGDTASVAHILFPIQLSPEGEDRLFDLMDDFEGVALEDGIAAAADSLGVELRSDVTVTQGFDFVPGAGALGVGVDWALDPSSPIAEVSEYFQNATGYHILEVVSRTSAGTFEFGEVEDQIHEVLAARMRHEAAMEAARDFTSDVESAATLEDAAMGLGWTVDTAGPFTRGQFVAGLGQDTEAVGAAFAHPIGEVAGPFDAGDVIVFMRVDERTEANPELFVAVREQLRSQVQAQLRQENAGRWISALRDNATIVDRRDRLNAQAAAL